MTAPDAGVDKWTDAITRLRWRAAIVLVWLALWVLAPPGGARGVYRSAIQRAGADIVREYEAKR